MNIKIDVFFFIKNSDSPKHFFFIYLFFNKRSFNHILFSYQFQRIFANKNNILSKAYSFIHKNQPLISAYIIHVHFFNFFWACSFIHKKQFRTRMCYGLFCILLMLQFVCWNYEYHNHYNFFIKKLDSSKHFIYFFFNKKSFNHILFSWQFQRTFANRNNILSKACSFFHKNELLTLEYTIRVCYFGLFCVLLML